MCEKAWKNTTHPFYICDWTDDGTSDHWYQAAVPAAAKAWLHWIRAIRNNNERTKTHSQLRTLDAPTKRYEGRDKHRSSTPCMGQISSKSASLLHWSRSNMGSTQYNAIGQQQFSWREGKHHHKNIVRGTVCVHKFKNQTASLRPKEARWARWTQWGRRPAKFEKTSKSQRLPFLPVTLKNSSCAKAWRHQL